MDAPLINPHTLLSQHWSLPEKVAKRYVQRFNPMYEDVIATGRIRLWEACQKFDARLNIEFVKYAYTLVHHAILDYLRYTIRRSKKLVSIDADWNGFEGSSFLDVLVEEPPADNRYTGEYMAEELRRAMNTLPARERHILNLYYFEGMNGPAIASMYNVSKMRVSQIINGALKMLRRRVKIA